MKKALVIGLGLSGAAAAGFLLRRGFSVVGVDGNETRLMEYSAFNELKELGLEVYSDSCPLNVADFELVVVSPGVAQSHVLYRASREKGLEVIGEAELAFRHLSGPCVGITGTNGKTTVALLVEHILNAAGIRAKSLGNVGKPLVEYAENPEEGTVVVAELSSYQLETMRSRVFRAGVILNITPDHLDRYGSMREYAAAKCRLQQCIEPSGDFYVHVQTAFDFKDLLREKSFHTFGSSRDAAFWTDKCTAKEGEKVAYILPLSYREIGVHESENALAAWLLVRHFGVSAEQFCRGLETFKKPAHRIEFVKNIGGISYYDDSKGTNVDATIQAVSSMEGQVILIAGGVDKGSSYAPWKEYFRNKVKRIIALGDAAGKMRAELRGEFQVDIVNSMGAAVKLASAYASRGDSILLSPGCASFDMFRDYAHRGEEFKRHVMFEEERKIP